MECGTKQNHQITIVGYTDTYWLIKNSMGTGWGDKGYGKIAIIDGDGVCGINRSPIMENLALSMVQKGRTILIEEVCLYGIMLIYAFIVWLKVHKTNAEHRAHKAMRHALVAILICLAICTFGSIINLSIGFSYLHNRLMENLFFIGYLVCLYYVSHALILKD
mmetsp:Transcript_118846/g.165596  ORF Transcript_118846/g.165596 Transcript_118846/m.165596 type:complete len:163 (+) Transcript_118846:115-603(+)|eukprot:CAMPEP_0176347314 /NCGR_PEP_ID=MMETSP0126-20121128/6956_1 /TAXON_ID=141414 ORGANISM="Strombidinopsis acuminatum, Strain SPMC142" /NCGR_SAMPLE_ID=MMETSP0126 /ASSEMBLY_ACC=CAM_ASM_000229 /LENGTH=162 /DNA_ID=CAMNT_0017695411 /DNA_START=683 /DNA_END=1171 /DNA_ORIENTATION=+